ncbi:uncharacterized protein LOC135376135 [Ornithodoros turicata]|uniref:uncharacterized protein LOC135376135 n=1 Tax=Ornithodoros turicata TaxID=34597 RepID=UPI00313938FD
MLDFKHLLGPTWTCSKHFHPDDFVQTHSLVRLRPCAVPKFFPQHEHAGTTSGAEATVEGTMVASTSFAAPLQTQRRAIETSFELLWDPLTTMEMEVDSCSPSTEHLPVELVSQMSQAVAPPSPMNLVTQKGTSPIPCDSLVDMQAESASSVMGGAPSVEQVKEESPVLSQEYMEEKEQHVSELLWDPLVSVDTEEAEGPREVHSTSALRKENSEELPLTSFGVSSSPYAMMTKLYIYALSCNVRAQVDLH